MTVCASGEVGASGEQVQPLLLAETLGLAMARRAAEILDRQRAAPAGGPFPGGGAEQYARDDAVFTAVLDAASECLGPVGAGDAGGRWCEALLQVLSLGRLGGQHPGDGARSARLPGDGHLAEQ